MKSAKCVGPREIGAYRTHLIVDRGLGALAADGYCRCLRSALNHMRWRRPTPARIRRHVLWMRESGYSYSHVVNTSLALEHWSSMSGVPLRLGRPRKPKQIISGVLTEAEVSRLIQAHGDPRRRAMIALLAYSGMRNAELCKIRVDDVDLAANTVRIRGGKNIKDRQIAISVECARAALDYLKNYPRQAKDPMFTTIVRGNSLQPGDVRKILREAATKAGITRRVYPHLLRHSLATNLLGRGASLMLIKEQLGHSFIDSTMIYISAVPARMRSEYDFFKPAYL